MNYKALDIGLKATFLVITAFIAADMVNTVGKGAVQTMPSFKLPERINKQQSTMQAPLEEAGKETNVASAAALPSVKLMGTVTGALPYAVFLDFGSNKQEIYRLKSDLGAGWLINEIEKNKVVLKKGDIKEVLEVKFIEGEPKAEVGAGLKPAPTGTGIRLDPRDVEGALSDMNAVMAQARVTPNIEGGKTTGYKIFNIAPGSIYTKLGIQNNDVVERVNGVDINNPDTLYTLFQQIKSERKIALDFNRNGRRESVNIEIR